MSAMQMPYAAGARPNDNTSNMNDPTLMSPDQQLANLLESMIPGMSILSKIFMTYFRIDISQYLTTILLLVGLSTALKYVSESLRSFWTDYFISSAEITYDDEMYNYLMYWISRHGLSQRTTHFTAKTQTNSHAVWTGDDIRDEDETDGSDRIDVDDSDNSLSPGFKKLRFTPSAGTHFFWYKRRILAFTRHQEQEQGIWARGKTDQVYISCLGRNPQILKDLLLEAQTAYLARDGNKTIIYRGSRPIGGSNEDLEWIRCMSRPPRPLSTVVLDEAQKDRVIQDMREYLHPVTKHWYSNRGIPYRRGYILYGPPGTGKTSLCFAVAGLLRLRIYVVNLNSKNINEDSLANLFRELPSRCIVLLEDIDSAGLVKRDLKEGAAEEEAAAEEAQSAADNVEKNIKAGVDPANSGTPAAVNKALSLSGFLNIIDGVASAEGRILIMTTNNIEALDPALLRPGRVDATVQFGYANKPAIAGLFRAIYSNQELEQLSQSSAPTSPTSEKKRSSSPSSEKSDKKGRGLSPSAPTALSLGFRYLHHGKSDDEIAEMAEQFAAVFPVDEFTPAEIQGYLLRFKMDPTGAIDGVENWAEERRLEKKKLQGKA